MNQHFRFFSLSLLISTFYTVPVSAQGYNDRIELQEIEIRRLIGEVETLKYQNMRLQKDLDKFRTEVNLKFEMLSSEEDSIDKKDNKSPRPKNDNITTILKDTRGTSAQILYDAAQADLQRKNFVAAEKNFQRIIDDYPHYKLRPNAYYWLGETFYARKDYNKAAMAFLDGKRQYPNSPKAGHNLYKLAMSLHFLGESKEACIALDEVEKKYLPKDEGLRTPLMSGKSKAGC